MTPLTPAVVAQLAEQAAHWPISDLDPLLVQQVCREWEIGQQAAALQRCVIEAAYTDKVKAESALTDVTINRDALLRRIEIEREYVEQAGRDRDEARANAERFRQSMYATEESSARQFARAEQAEAALAAARAALQAVEWIDSGPGEGLVSVPGEDTTFCPWCGCRQSDGHACNCQRQAALGMGEGRS